MVKISLSSLDIQRLNDSFLEKGIDFKGVAIPMLACFECNAIHGFFFFAP